jgi:hypothetical protein
LRKTAIYGKLAKMSGGHENVKAAHPTRMELDIFQTNMNIVMPAFG